MRNKRIIVQHKDDNERLTREQNTRLRSGCSRIFGLGMSFTAMFLTKYSRVFGRHLYSFFSKTLEFPERLHR